MLSTSVAKQNYGLSVNTSWHSWTVTVASKAATSVCYHFLVGLHCGPVVEFFIPIHAF